MFLISYARTHSAEECYLVQDIFATRLQELKNGELTNLNEWQLKELNRLFNDGSSWEDNKFYIYNCFYFYNDVLDYNAFNYVLGVKGAKCQKRKRAKTKINLLVDLKLNLEKILDKKINIVFGTLTLNDDFLKKTENNQRVHLQNELKKHCFWYLKNADYCPTTNRLHYHYLGLSFKELDPAYKTNEDGSFVLNKDGLPIQCKSKKGRPMYKYKNDTEPLGYHTLEIVPEKCTKDLKKISCYLVKLNNHTNKVSTLNGEKISRLVISQNNSVLDDLGVLNLVNYMKDQYIPKKSKNTQK